MTLALYHTMLPDGHLTTQSTTVNGRLYTASAGSALSQVPYSDADELEANKWVKAARGGAGPTSGRPTTLRSGQPLHRSYEFLDTTLGYIIVWDGVTWRNPATGASV